MGARARFVALVGVVLGGVVAAFFAVGRGEEERSRSTDDGSQEADRATLAASGTQREVARAYRYAVELTGEDRVEMPPLEALGGAIRLRGEVVLERQRRGFALRVASVSSLRFDVLGRDIADEETRQALLEAVVEAELGAMGEVVSLRMPSGTPPAVEALLRLLALELAVPRVGVEVERRRASGRMREVARESFEGGVRIVETEWTRYESLDLAGGRPVPGSGQRSARFDGEGLVSLRGTERVEARLGEERVRLVRDLRMERRGSADGLGPLGELVETAVERVEAPAMDPTAMLRQRAGGLDTAAMVDRLLEGAPEGDALADFLWQASAVVALDPEAPRALADVFLDPGAGPRVMEIVLDLLAQVGTAEAEAVLRELVVSERCRSSSLAPSLVSRLSFLPHPRSETIALAERELARTNAPEWAAVNGNLAYRARRAGRVDEATRIRRNLTARLERARDPALREAYAVALGATRDPEAYDALLRLARSSSAQDRAAAADALGSIGDDRSRGTLSAMVHDSDASVRRNALRALERAAPRAEDLALLAEALRRGVLSDSEADALYSVVARVVFELPAAVYELCRIAVERQYGNGQERARFAYLAEYASALIEEQRSRG